MRRIALGISNRERPPEANRAPSEVHRPLARVHSDGKRLSPHGYYCRKVDRRTRRPFSSRGLTGLRIQIIRRIQLARRERTESDLSRRPAAALLTGRDEYPR